MPAVYFVAAHNVSDPEQLKQYMASAGGTLGAGEVLAADTSATTVEGDDRSRVVILRFPSRESFDEWYNSADYQKALPLRLNAVSDNWAGLADALG